MKICIKTDENEYALIKKVNELSSNLIKNSSIIIDIDIRQKFYTLGQYMQCDRWYAVIKYKENDNVK